MSDVDDLKFVPFWTEDDFLRIAERAFSDPWGAATALQRLEFSDNSVFLRMGMTTPQDASQARQFAEFHAASLSSRRRFNALRGDIAWAILNELLDEKNAAPKS